jgi:hypothetical protein
VAVQRLTRRLAPLLSKRANFARRLYAQELETIVRAPLEIPSTHELAVYTFSSEAHLPEQVASIRSLLRHLGAPRQIVVVSDGSHRPASAKLLERIHPAVSVLHHREVLRNDLPAAVRRYASHSPMGVKLGLEVSMPVSGPTMYVDADVLFFPRIFELGRDVSDDDGRPRYLQDFGFFLDKRLLQDEGEAAQPVNAGFLMLSKPLQWDPALERLERLSEEPSFLTEQTLVHLAMQDSDGRPLPPDRYVLRVDDSPEWRDRYAGPAIALRHYCYDPPTQRKLWMNVWDDLMAAAREEPGAAIRGVASAASNWRRDRQRSKPSHVAERG